MRQGVIARGPLCVAGQLAPGTSRATPVGLDTFGLILKGITLRGLSADNDLAAFDERLPCFDSWRLDPCARCLPKGGAMV